MSTRQTTSRSVTLIAIVPTLALLLTACGASSDASTDTASDPETSASSAPSGAPGGPGGRGGFDQEQLDAIQKCLEAAGLGDAFPTDLPTDRPSDFPTDLPSDRPSDLPSGGPGGPGAFGAFNDPDVQAALQACGIELPTGRPSAPASS